MPERHGDQRRAHHAGRARPPGESADPAKASVASGGRRARIVPAHGAILPAAQARRPPPRESRRPGCRPYPRNGCRSGSGSLKVPRDSRPAPRGHLLLAPPPLPALYLWFLPCRRRVPEAVTVRPGAVCAGLVDFRTCRRSLLVVMKSPAGRADPEDSAGPVQSATSVSQIRQHGLSQHSLSKHSRRSS